MHIVSLVVYEAQLVPPLRAIVAELRRILQRVVRAPWLAIPTVVLEDFEGLDLPLESRNIDRVALCAQWRGRASLGVWDLAQKRIREFASSEAPALEPSRPCRAECDADGHCAEVRRAIMRGASRRL